MRLFGVGLGSLHNHSEEQEHDSASVARSLQNDKRIRSVAHPQAFAERSDSARSFVSGTFCNVAAGTTSNSNELYKHASEQQTRQSIDSTLTKSLADAAAQKGNEYYIPKKPDLSFSSTRSLASPTHMSPPAPHLSPRLQISRELQTPAPAKTTMTVIPPRQAGKAALESLQYLRTSTRVAYTRSADDAAHTQREMHDQRSEQRSDFHTKISDTGRHDVSTLTPRVTSAPPATATQFSHVSPSKQDDKMIIAHNQQSDNLLNKFTIHSYFQPKSQSTMVQGSDNAGSSSANTLSLSQSMSQRHATFKSSSRALTHDKQHDNASQTKSLTAKRVLFHAKIISSNDQDLKVTNGNPDQDRKDASVYDNKLNSDRDTNLNLHNNASSQNSKNINHVDDGTTHNHEDEDEFVPRRFFAHSMHKRESIWSINKRWNEMMSGIDSTRDKHQANGSGDHSSVGPTKSRATTGKSVSSISAESTIHSQSDIAICTVSHTDTLSSPDASSSSNNSPTQDTQQTKRQRDKKSISFNEKVLCRSISRVEDLKEAFDREMEIMLASQSKDAQERSRKYEGDSVNDDQETGGIGERKDRKALLASHRGSANLYRARAATRTDWSDDDDDAKEHEMPTNRSRKQALKQKKETRRSARRSKPSQAETQSPHSVNERTTRQKRSRTSKHDNSDENSCSKVSFDLIPRSSRNNDDNPGFSSASTKYDSDSNEEGQEMDLDAMLDSTLFINDSHLALRPPSAAPHDDADELLRAFSTGRDLGMDPIDDRVNVSGETDVGALLDYAIREIGDVGSSSLISTQKHAHLDKLKDSSSANQSTASGSSESIENANTDTKQNVSRPENTTFADASVLAVGESTSARQITDSTKLGPDYASIADVRLLDEYVISLLRVTRIENGELMPVCGSITSLAAACPTPPERSNMSTPMTEIAEFSVKSGFTATDDGLTVADGRTTPMRAWNSETSDRVPVKTVEETASTLLSQQSWINTPSFSKSMTGQVDLIKELEELLDHASETKQPFMESTKRSSDEFMGTSATQTESETSQHQLTFKLAPTHSESTPASSERTSLGESPQKSSTNGGGLSYRMQFIESIVRPLSRGRSQQQGLSDRSNKRQETRNRNQRLRGRNMLNRRSKLVRPQTPTPGLWQTDPSLECSKDQQQEISDSCLDKHANDASENGSVQHGAKIATQSSSSSMQDDLRSSVLDSGSSNSTAEDSESTVEGSKDVLRRGPRQAASTKQTDSALRRWNIWMILKCLFSRHSAAADTARRVVPIS